MLEEDRANLAGMGIAVLGGTTGSGTRETEANRQEVVSKEVDKEVFAGRVGIAGGRTATLDIQMEESWMNKLVIIMVMVDRTNNKAFNKTMWDSRSLSST